MGTSTLHSCSWQEHAVMFRQRPLAQNGREVLSIFRLASLQLPVPLLSPNVPVLLSNMHVLPIDTSLTLGIPRLKPAIPCIRIPSIDSSSSTLRYSRQPSSRSSRIKYGPYHTDDQYSPQFPPEPPPENTENALQDAELERQAKITERTFLGILLLVFGLQVAVRKKRRREAPVEEQLNEGPRSGLLKDEIEDTDDDLDRYKSRLFHGSGTPYVPIDWELFVRRNFPYSPAAIFPVPGSFSADFRPWVMFTHLFAHATPMHLLFCYFSLKVFTRDFIFHFGQCRSIGLFLAGGALASLVRTSVEQLINPAASMTKQEIYQRINSPLVDESEKKTLARYNSLAVGSSGALISLGIFLFSQSSFTTPIKLLILNK